MCPMYFSMRHRLLGKLPFRSLRTYSTESVHVCLSVFGQQGLVARTFSSICLQKGFDWDLVWKQRAAGMQGQHFVLQLEVCNAFCILQTLLGSDFAADLFSHRSCISSHFLNFVLNPARMAGKPALEEPLRLMPRSRTCFPQHVWAASACWQK